MDCRQFKEHMVGYLYQELTSEQLQQFKDHLNECDSCEDELNAFQSTKVLLKALPQLEPPSHLTQKLLFEAQRPSFWGQIRLGIRALVLHPAMTAAAVLMLVIGISYYAYQGTSPIPQRIEPPLFLPKTQQNKPKEVEQEKKTERGGMVGSMSQSVSNQPHDNPPDNKRETLSEVIDGAKPKKRNTPRRSDGKRKKTGLLAPKRLARFAAIPKPELASTKDSDPVTRDRFRKGSALPLSLKMARRSKKVGNCESALSYYHKVLAQQPKLKRTVVKEAKQCLRLLRRGSLNRLAKTQALPLFAGCLEAEMAERRQIAKRTQQRLSDKKKVKHKAIVPQKAAPKSTY